MSSSVMLAAAILSPASAAEKMPTVPEGFTIQKVAAAPLVKHPMLAGFDDRGRLFIASSAGMNLRAPDLEQQLPNFVQMLEDTDGDGTFDNSTLFADKMTFPMGALWHRGALYVASPPNIWKLEDTNGDGVADKRTILVDKFGYTGNAADVHGCFLGPNGRIYWCDGRHGHEFRDSHGNIVSKGKAARIFSCRPDGSDVQVWCGGGMDNPVEIDFTDTGEMFGTVNILIGKPRVDCLMHWVDGGVYPRDDQQDCIAEFKKTGDLLPPMTQLGHVAVSGMTIYRSAEFGPDYQGNVFTTLFNTHKIVRSKVTRSGATFTTTEEDFLVSDDVDFHPTDVFEDADGSLLVIDTGGWFRIGCPVSEVAKPDIYGAIYRIRRNGAHQMDDPRGLKLDLASQNPEQLAKLLDDSRPAVRERAIDLLARRGDEVTAALNDIITKAHGSQPVGPGAAAPSSQHSVTARRNAVWALSRIETEAARAILREALTDPDEGVRLAAARSLGTLENIDAMPELAKLVREDTPAVRSTAAAALGRITQAGRTGMTADAQSEAIKALFAGLRGVTNDRYLEHAVIYAVIRLADRNLAIPYLSDPNPQVRRAALIALDQMEGGNLSRELVTPLLDTDDPALQKEALAVIGSRDGWAGETLQLLKGWLADGQLSEERAAVLRGFLLAQTADPDVQSLVAQSLARETLSLPVRLLLLEVIHRSNVDALPEAWLSQLERELRHSDPQARLQTIRIVQSRGGNRFDAQLHALADDVGQPPEVRVESLIALAPRLKSLEGTLFAFLLGQLNEETSPLLRLSAARAVGDAPLDDAQLMRLAGDLDSAGPLAIPVLLRAFSQSKNAGVGRSLVAALEKSSASTNLSADELGTLLRNYPPEVQTAANGLLGRLGVNLDEQRAILEKMIPLVSGGDELRGREVFFGKKAMCASCHAVAGQGSRIGPDLTKIGGIRTAADLVEAIILPSATFAREFRPYAIVTAEGKVFTGIISRQTSDMVYLRTAELAEIRIPRDGIEEMKESNVSIMPKGLEQRLTEDELRDLLAYLKGLR